MENTNNEVIEIDSGKVEAGTSLTVYYVVIIFVYADVQQVGGNNKEKKWEAESSNLLYSIDAIQEEVEDEKN